MLKTARVNDTASTHRLIKVWATRYLPDFSALPQQKGEFPAAELVETASSKGRANTVDKVLRSLQINCERAGLETQTLFSYVPNIVNLSDARRIARHVTKVYETTLNIYKHQQSPSYYLQFIDTSSLLFSRLALPSLMLPVIYKLAEEVEPILLQLQDQHIHSADPRTIGFITTQFHFSTRTLLNLLTPCERVLLTPYLKFIEDQVCTPWQRLCAATDQYLPGSATVSMVEHLLEKSQDIAQAVYDRALQTHPYHRSRRGSLGDLGIAASTLRDLNMFQTYLWLCVLEGNMSSIEQELLPLCVAVFPSIGVKWDLVEAMLQSLETEIHARVDAQQSDRLRPDTQALRRLFASPKLRLVSAAKYRKIDLSQG
jgi:Phycobilisome protein